MAKIYKRSDLIPIQIDDVVVKVSPLTHDQKVEVQQAFLNGLKGDFKEGSKGVFLSLKYAVRDIKGIEDIDGNQYKLEFDGDVLKDSCVDDLLNTTVLEKLSLVCSTLAKSIPTEFTDNQNRPIEGVKILNSGDAEKNA